MRFPKGFPKVGHYTAMKRKRLLPNQSPNKKRNESPKKDVDKDKENENDMILTTIEALQSLEPTEFENLVSTLLVQMGFNVSTTKASGDGGIDIVAINEQPIVGGQYIVQCKRYATGNNVGEPAIRDLFGVMHSENANKGILITTSDFTRQAILFAEDKAIELINGSKLLSLIDEHIDDMKTTGEFLSEQESEQNLFEAERFARATKKYFQREKLKVRRSKMQLSDYKDFLREEFFPECFNIKEYEENLIDDIYNESLLVVAGDHVSENSSWDEVHEKALQMATDLDKKELSGIELHFYFALSASLSGISVLIDSEDKEVYFDLIDDYLERAYGLYQTMISIEAPEQAKDIHENEIKIVESLISMFSAVKEFLDTRNKLLVKSVIKGKEDLLLAWKKRSQIGEDLNKPKGSCFIATTVYESPFASEVSVLRDWRDNYLSKFWFGRQFIRIYYKVGPLLAHLVAKSKVTKNVLRMLLDAFVRQLKGDI